MDDHRQKLKYGKFENMKADVFSCHFCKKYIYVELYQ